MLRFLFLDGIAVALDSRCMARKAGGMKRRTITIEQFHRERRALIAARPKAGGIGRGGKG